MNNEIYQNAGKPVGDPGREMIEHMNSHHIPLASWGFSFISTKPEYNALDIGCGGGANIEKFLSLCVNGKVCGIDYSEVSVEVSRERNIEAIKANKCEILQGNVAALPFNKNSFDIVSAFETVYYWPDIVNSFAQVLNVLKPNGYFVICNEADGEDAENDRWEHIIEGMKIYTADELKGYLLQAGFKNIKINADKSKHWLCITAQK